MMILITKYKAGRIKTIKKQKSNLINTEFVLIYITQNRIFKYTMRLL